jgi:hypothetical protein
MAARGRGEASSSINLVTLLIAYSYTRKNFESRKEVIRL